MRHETTHNPDHPIAGNQLIDPVCGMNVSPGGEIYSVFDGVRYEFCSQGCKAKFDSDPKVRQLEGPQFA
ncbi:MAG: YHS domain-containing protein [Thermoanaerobaculia bacterium]